VVIISIKTEQKSEHRPHDTRSQDTADAKRVQ